MIPLSDVEKAELRTLAENATPGPWVATESGFGGWADVHHDPSDEMGEHDEVALNIYNKNVVVRLLDELDRADGQIKQLADFIMHEVEGEPSRSEGAVECAIRLLDELDTLRTAAKAYKIANNAIDVPYAEWIANVERTETALGVALGEQK